MCWTGEEECAGLGKRNVLDWGGGVCWTGEEECAGLGRGSAQL